MKQFTKELEKAIRKAVKEGWIEDFDDPWASLPCFGTMDNVNNNCEECPLRALCEESCHDLQFH